MAITNSKISSPTARAKNYPNPFAKPIYVKLATGISLGYRRNVKEGVWVARLSDGHGGNRVETIGLADREGLPADGVKVLSFPQAQARALAIRHDSEALENEPTTVAEAVDAYETMLTKRGGDFRNVSRLIRVLSPDLRKMPVSELTVRQLTTWRERLSGKRATVQRTCAVFRAVLNYAADIDHLKDRSAWTIGLKVPQSVIEDDETDKNIVLSQDAVSRIVAAARNHSPEFGLIVEAAAITGARYSQLVRCQVQDVQDGSEPRLVIPVSRKGRGVKKVQRRPVPITSGLAMRLKAVCVGRPATALLFLKPSGEAWRADDQAKRFRIVAKAAGEPGVTIYALRHTSITRQLLAGVPIRVVATNHDTSVIMIERTYSRHIGDHADGVVRSALVDIPELTDDAKVVPLRG